MVNRIVYKIIPPVISVLVAVFTVILLGVYVLYKYQIEKNIQEKLGKVDRVFDDVISQQADVMDSSLMFIKNDKKIQEGWLNRDREMLLSSIQDVFTELKSEYQITHLYFIDVDRTVFLRVHDPDKYGDKIDRQTLLDAEKKQQRAVGLEHGIQHYFILRDVQPWYVNGELVGYLEMGEEIGHLTKKIAHLLNAEIFVVFDKSFYSREKWEKGIELYGHHVSWDMLENSVILGKTLPEISESMKPYLDHEFGHTEQHVFKVKVGDAIYSGGYVPVKNFLNESVARFVVLNDITEKENRFNLVITVATIVSVLCIIIFLFYLRSYIKGIQVILFKNEQDLIEQANVDPLTKINNRRYLFSVSEKILLDRRTEKYMIIMDIDDFKKINDTYGHEKGDDCLKEFASLVKKEIRQEDVFVRLGGEEFVLILIGISKDNAIEKMEAMREKISQINIPTASAALSFTVSIGMTRLKLIDKKIDVAIKRADEALYIAKRQYKNCLRYIQ